jgi:hypothetical protein
VVLFFHRGAMARAAVEGSAFASIPERQQPGFIATAPDPPARAALLFSIVTARTRVTRGR